MSWSGAQTAIRARFEALTSLASDRQAKDGFNGPKWTAPVVDPDDYDDAVWCRVTVHPVPGSGRPLGIGAGAPRWREGLIVVQLFGPRGGGERRLRELVDETMGIFHRQSFGDVVCRDADEPDRIGFDSSGEWFQVNAVVPFYTLD